jgi:hypothetical protein
MNTPSFKELYTEYKDRNHQLISEMDYNEYTNFYSFVIDKSHMNENNNLYLLFVTGKLLEKETNTSTIIPRVNKPIKRSRSESGRTIVPTKFSRYNDYISNLTPYLKSYITPVKLEQYSQDLSYDDIIIKKLETVVDNDEYIDKQNYGKLVECWFADNCNCPICDQPTLRRYAKDNFPVIDLVCVNPLHTFLHGVRFFQVKSMSSEFEYFNFNTKLIHTGAYKFGKIVHSINVLDDDITKKVLIGYICISVTPKKDYLKVNKEQSFLVLPKTDINKVVKRLFEDNFDDFFVQYDDNDIIDKYYDYVDIANPIITFSLSNNNILKFSERYTTNLVIPIDYIKNTSWNMIDNPLFDAI